MKKLLLVLLFITIICASPRGPNKKVNQCVHQNCKDSFRACLQDKECTKTVQSCHDKDQGIIESLSEEFQSCVANNELATAFDQCLINNCKEVIEESSQESGAARGI